jgi:hypothetical protein
LADTEIAYLVTPDWYHQLFVSLSSLLSSGTEFDRLRIVCVGKRPGSWVFTDPRIVVEEVPRLDDGDFFMINKVHIVRTQADRLVFLDADTLVLGPLHPVWERRDEDFIGRETSICRRPGWDREGWNALLDGMGARRSLYFNSGFVVFQNGSHRGLADSWKEITEGGRSRELFDPTRFHKKGNVNQIALSLAVASAGLTTHEMEPREHAYGWDGDSWRDALLFHVGGRGYFAKARRILRSRGQRFRSPLRDRSREAREVWWKLVRGELGWFAGAVGRRLGLRRR